MLYQSQSSESKLWDTTIFHDGLHFQLIHIAGNGILGRARSTDWIHWERLPPIDIRGPEGSWNQNGLICNGIVRREGEWCLIAGADSPSGEWQMGLFTSSDLENWEAYPANPILASDGEIYTKGPNSIHQMHPAWRDPCLWQDKEGWWHCLMCARLPRWNHSTTGAAIAHLRSRNLIKWEPLQPVVEVGSRFLFCEVPNFFVLNGRHYLTFLDMGWGGTREHTTSRDDACGTFYLWAENFDGPWHWPTDPLLLGADDQCLASWAAKTLLHDERVYLYSHIASSGKSASLALPKEVVERAPGELELRYANQLGPCETTEFLEPDITPKIFHRPHDSGIWQAEDHGGLTARAESCGTAATIAREAGDFHLELRIEIQEGGAAGVVFRATEAEEKFLINGAPPQGVLVMLDVERQMIEMRGVVHVPMHGWGVGFMEARRANYSPVRRQRVRLPLSRKQSYRLRVIARSEFFEVYLNDIWQITIAQPEAAESGTIELVAQKATARFSGLRLRSLGPL